MIANESPVGKNKENRPISIAVISIFYWINAAAQGVNGVTRFGRLQGRESIPAISILLPIGNIILVLFFVVVGWGLWQLKPRARLAAILLSGLMIAISLFVFALALIYSQFLIPYNIVLHGLVLGALFSTTVKQVFVPS